ncbi:MAG TPA: ABC transporter substrate-binding protein [Mycobacteriales bacterium]|jgi:ABC-type branched-subunit amino acid transport system substrate-binding protein|nr:ABC transporter substrate-binding protein [Mycobacteriales bacterium]
MNARRTVQLGLLAAVTVAGSAACGGSGESAEAGTGSSSPIRVMATGALTPSSSFGGISFPYGVTGVKAAAEAINAKGGIKGRKIQVDTCDTKGDPNVSAQCAREALSNKDIAVLGAFDPLGAPQQLGVLEAAGIPYIGGLPTTPAEYSSPVSFQFDPGPVLASTAIAKLWVDSGCTTVVAILPANPGNDQLAAQQKQQAQALGLKITTQLVQPGIADVTPSLTTALATKPDCFTYGGDGQTSVKYILAARKLGYTGKFLTSSGSLLPQFLAPLGAAGDGIIVLNSALQPTSDDPMVKQFAQELSDHLKGNPGEIAKNSNEFAQVGWSSVQLLKQAIEGGSDASAKGLLAHIPTMCDVNVGNVYPHVNFCKTVATSKSLTRVYNNQWQYFVAKDGKYVPTDNTWHDLTSTFPRS